MSYIEIRDGIFGDGNHETTKAILEFMGETDFKGKTVLDIGCGSGILTVKAHELGAKYITAIDHDSRAVDNTKTNLELNGITNAKAVWVDFMETDLKADIILANLPRESGAMCFPKMVSSLNDGGVIIMSWFKELPSNPLSRYEVLKKCEGNEYDIIYLKKKKEEKKWQE